MQCSCNKNDDDSEALGPQQGAKGIQHCPFSEGHFSFFNFFFLFFFKPPVTLYSVVPRFAFECLTLQKEKCAMIHRHRYGNALGDMGR